MAQNRDTDISELNKLKDLPYRLCFINDSQAFKYDSIKTNEDNLVVVVPDLDTVDKLCFHGVNFRGIVKRDFVKDLNVVLSEKISCAQNFKFNIADYPTGLEKIRPYVDEGLWKKIHIFADEAVSNIILHSGKSEGVIESFLLKNNIIVLSVTDSGGRLVSRNLRKALCSLCASYDVDKEFDPENIIIGGNGLKLLFHYVTFIKFNVIPFELTQIVGVFIPDRDFNGYIFEDRREEISDDCLFRQI